MGAIQNIDGGPEGLKGYSEIFKDSKGKNSKRLGLKDESNPSADASD